MEILNIFMTGIGYLVIAGPICLGLTVALMDWWICL